MEMKHLVLFVPDYMARRMKEYGHRLEKICMYGVVKNIFAPADLAGLLYINRNMASFVGELDVRTPNSLAYKAMSADRAIVDRWTATATNMSQQAEIENIELLSTTEAIDHDVSVRLYCENQFSGNVPVTEAFVLSDNEPHITFVTIAEQAFCKNGLLNLDKQKVLVKAIVAKLYGYMTEAEVASTYFFRRYLEHLSLMNR